MFINLIDLLIVIIKYTPVSVIQLVHRGKENSKGIAVKIFSFLNFLPTGKKEHQFFPHRIFFLRFSAFRLKINLEHKTKFGFQRTLIYAISSLLPFGIYYILLLSGFKISRQNRGKNTDPWEKYKLFLYDFLSSFYINLRNQWSRKVID